MKQSKDFSNLDAYELFSELMAKQKSLLNGLITVKGGLGLIGWALKLFRLVSAKAPSKSTVKVVRHFSKECFTIARCSGIGHLVKYLKTCGVLLQQYAARNDATTPSRRISSVAVSVTRRGLPRIIPAQHRVLIRKGNRQTITLWLSLFNVYRYLASPYGKNSYKTIVSPGNGWKTSTEVNHYIHHF